uniref:Uncharacterized protein n=1 Tax=viral metagenome TaxID=1070528 RepID=A0A6M3M3X9_9ZZZZ
MLVWKGKIIEKINTACPHGDYLCEFSCHEFGPFRLVVCAQLFVERNGDDVAIPMEFSSGDKVYSPGAEVTPLSKELELV